MRLSGIIYCYKLKIINPWEKILERERKQRDHGVNDDKDPLFIEEILL